MASAIQQTLRQNKPFPTVEGEIIVGLQVVANRLRDNWGQYLRTQAAITVNQYNVLRILRGSHPDTRTCSEISGRMIERDPDITRLLDRLSKQGLVDRSRDDRDRRVVRVGITSDGLDLLARLDRPASNESGSVLQGLTAPELEQLRAALNTVVAHLDDQPSDNEDENE